MPAELAPDTRLCAGRLPHLTVEVTSSNGVAMLASVRAISSQDLVLIVPADIGLEIGEIVSFAIYENGVSLASDQSGVIHWMVGDDDVRLMALFSVNHLDEYVEHRVPDDRRGEIRFPTDISVQVRCGRRLVDARIVNYSLNGVGMMCREQIELNQEYIATGTGREAEIRLSIETQWQTKVANGFLTGCALEAQHGVLLARRTAAPVGSAQYRLLAQIASDLNVEDANVEHPQAQNEPLISRRGLGLDSSTLLRSSTPMLSTFLIGMSLQSSGPMRQLTLLTGLIGVMASLVFSVLARCKE